MQRPLTKHLKNENYKNWLKGVLGTVALKDGLKGYIEKLLEIQYNDIVKGNEEESKLFRKLQQEVNTKHLNKPATFKNSRISEKVFNYVEFGKCFIKTTGHKDATKVSDIDCAGLLQICMYNKDIKDYMVKQPNPEENENGAQNITKCILHEALDDRNKIMHNVDIEIEKEEFQRYIDDMLEVLNSLQSLPRPHTQSDVVIEEDIERAKGYLQMLKHKEFHISLDDEINACSQALNEITSDVKQLNETVGSHSEVLTDHGDRISALEDKSDDHEKRLNRLEVLNNQKSVYSSQLEYVKYKKELQKDLIELYMEHHVKTSLCPLKPEENNLDISEIFVEPYLLAEKKLSGSTKDTTDIFCDSDKELRKVYIVGDVGTGKSTLCKMLLYEWCIAHKDCSENAVHQESSLLQRIKKKIRDFDYLLYACLENSHEKIYVEDIIKTQLVNEVRHIDKLDVILNLESDRCLIILDGLDEWPLPNKLDHKSNRVTYGIPIADLTKQYTIITTSRPTARGIIHLKQTEYDRKLTIMGISQNKLRDFTNKYLSKHGVKMSADDFRAIVLNSKLRNPEKCPMLLSQIVWTYCYNKSKNEPMGTANSSTEIYSKSVNTFFRWAEEKAKCLDLKIGRSQYCNLELPSALEKYPSFIQFDSLLFLHGEIAFDQLQAMLEPSSKRLLHISENDLCKLSELGILSTKKCDDPSLRKTSSFFVHISYLEYFAALYMASNCRKLRSEAEVSLNDDKTTRLSSHFSCMQTVEAILKCSNVLQFICGMAPEVTTRLYTHVSKIVSEEETLKQYRHLIEDCIETKDIIRQVQKLIFSFLSEMSFGKRSHESNLNLSDVLIEDFDDNERLAYLASVNPCNILSLEIDSLLDDQVTVTLLRSIVSSGHLVKFVVRDTKNNLGKHAEDIFGVIKCSQPSLCAISVQNTDCYDQCIMTSIEARLFGNPDPFNFSSCIHLISNTKNLQALHLENIGLSHDYLVCLKQFVQNTKLQQLSLKHLICCHETQIEHIFEMLAIAQYGEEDIDKYIPSCTHALDLTQNNCLQYLQLEGCSLYAERINTEIMETCKLTTTTRKANTLHIMGGCSHIKIFAVNGYCFPGFDIGNLVSKLEHMQQITDLYLDMKLHFFDHPMPFIRTFTELRNIYIRHVTMNQDPWQVFIECICSLPNVKKIKLTDFVILEHSGQITPELFWDNCPPDASANLPVPNIVLDQVFKPITNTEFQIARTKISSEAWKVLDENIRKLEDLERLVINQIDTPDLSMTFSPDMTKLRCVVCLLQKMTNESWDHFLKTLNSLPQNVHVLATYWKEARSTENTPANLINQGLKDTEGKEIEIGVYYSETKLHSRNMLPNIF